MMTEDGVLQKRLALREKVPIVGIALELAVFKISAPDNGQRKYWVTDCPICGAEGQFTLVSQDTFQCGACRTTGDTATMIRLFRKGATWEDALRYMQAWADANPTGQMRMLPSAPIDV